jgi:DNA polymerase III sliding clamp (beta) subunit (PCNA family)
MVATDGHRLSLVEMDGDAPPTSALFSRSSLKWMKENVGEWAALGIGTDYNVICSARKTLLFRKLTGQFPKYEKVIPKSSEVTVTATFPSIRELRSTLSRVAKCADEASGCVQWQFGLNPKIATKSVNRGSASAPLDCKVEGELTISWCNSYITDLLSIVEDGELTIQMKDAQSASLFQLDGVKYIVMPMRAFNGENL